MRKKSAPSYQQSKEFTPTAGDIETFKAWKNTGPITAPGMVKPGNIDLTKRPIVHHKDGSVSSLYSGSFDLPNGNQVLVPFVSPDGKMMTPKQAFARYEETGENLGVFKTSKDADSFANLLHLKQGAFQTWKNGGKYNPSVETYDNWTEK